MRCGTWGRKVEREASGVAWGRARELHVGGKTAGFVGGTAARTRRNEHEAGREQEKEAGLVGCATSAGKIKGVHPTGYLADSPRGKA
jgi:hypothetical protein